jgi:hypothetical protein
VSLPLADGPAMYFGSTILTFALPLGAFIAVAVALFFLFRSVHSGPKLKYLGTDSFTSIGTREPGPVPDPPVAAAEAELAADPETPITPESIESVPEPITPEPTGPEAPGPEAPGPESGA